MDGSIHCPKSLLKPGNGTLTGNGTFAAGLLDPDVEIPAGVTDPGGRPAPKRYSVYRNNVVASLMEAMAAAYPSLNVIMGEDNFRRVCRNYVAMNPPDSAVMLDYGGTFASFLQNFPPLSKSPFLADIARAERAWLEAFHSADAAVLSPDALATIDPESARKLVFHPHPAQRLVTSDWPIADLFQWRFGRPEGGTALTSGQSIAITRPLFEVQVWQIEASSYRFFALLSDGATLCDAAGETSDEFDDFDLQFALTLAFDAGMFSSVDVPDPI